MPEEINTGGPRVLHCVERAESPITRTQFSYPSRVHCCPTIERRSCYVDPINCRARNLTKLLPGKSAERYRVIPGNDERNEFFSDERSPPVSTTSSNDLGYLGGAPRDHRGRKRHGAHSARRQTIDRRTSHCSDMQQHSSASTANYQDVPEVDEISHEENETWQRRSKISYQSNSGSPKTSGSHLIRSMSEDDNRERPADSSAIVMRLFGDCCGCDIQVRELMYPEIGEPSAATSSQRLRPSVDTGNENSIEEDITTREYYVNYAWQCKCNPQSSQRHPRVTHERRKRCGSVHHKGRSYFQLALVLFLVIFGHGSLLKSNFVGVGGKPGIGTGLSLLTIGTVVGAVRAVPIDSDAGVRAERSANLSHITGVSRKIQMYIKNRHLQILPDGTVNGSNDDTSEYSE